MLSGPFELAAGPIDEAALFRYEDLLAAHPISERLNRAWMAVARRV